MHQRHQSKVKRELKNVLRVLVAIVLGMLLCALIGGCSPRIVEVERPVVVEQTHTQTHTDIVRDTLIWRDSVYHYVQGDTVRIERWHHVANVNKMIVTDTIRDTIPKVVTVTRTERVEVERKASLIERALMWAGGIGIAGTLLLVAARIRQRR